MVEIGRRGRTLISPVLAMSEAPHHPHNQARKTFVEVDGAIQPAPGPRFSRTPPPLTPRMSRIPASIALKSDCNFTQMPPQPCWLLWTITITAFSRANGSLPRMIQIPAT